MKCDWLNVISGSHDAIGRNVADGGHTTKFNALNDTEVEIDSAAVILRPCNIFRAGHTMKFNHFAQYCTVSEP